MSLSSELRNAAAVASLIITQALPASAEDSLWDISGFVSADGPSDYTISVPSSMFLSDGMSEYFPQPLIIDEHRTSTKSFGLRARREWGPSQGYNGGFFRIGGDVRYSYSKGILNARVGDFITESQRRISNDLHGTWQEAAGEYSDLVSESDVNRVVTRVTNTALDFLSENPQYSFSSNDIDIPEYLPTQAQNRLRYAFDQIESSGLLSANSLSGLSDLAYYRDNNEFEFTGHTVGVYMDSDIGYRTHPRNIFDVDSVDYYAGLRGGYEAHYMDLGSVGGIMCHGPAASLQIGSTVSFDDTKALNFRVSRSFGLEQDCMGATREPSKDPRFSLEYTVEF